MSERSIRIGWKAAQKLQAKAVAGNDLLVWTVYDHPSDYPKSYIARPFSTNLKKALTCHLQYPTVEGLRLLLPHGLTHIPRAPSDDPKIMESWI